MFRIIGSILFVIIVAGGFFLVNNDSDSKIPSKSVPSQDDGVLNNVKVN